ncbi:MAG: DUF3793 family protein [Oscillospiraceae bacterium]|nr:DUF3793 family protein [Oscillospiraceae bacterium]
MPEDLMVRFCAPTLAGLKTGSMFSCPYDSVQALKADIREMNRRLGGKGLRVLPLRYQNRRALIYVYRPRKLEADLEALEAATLLAGMGYPVGSSDRCVRKLMHRLREESEFPHEVGLFLGYPPEDVWGFIENRAEDCKCVGCWKVYGDEDAAKRLFRKYHKCTEVYCSCLQRGFSMERLTVAAR